MTIHTNQGTINNGFYAPNMRAHMDSFTNIIPTPCSYYTPKIDPIRIEPIRIEQIRIEPIKFEPFKF